MRTLIISSLLVSMGLLALFIGIQHGIDYRLADKAMDRLEIMDEELGELDQESITLGEKLNSPDISEAEHDQLAHELKIVETRWLLGQYEAFRVLTSVADLRFIQTESEIISLSRRRMMMTIESAVDSGRPALAEAIIATLLERKAEGTLVNPLTEEDLHLLTRLADEAKNTKLLPDP